MLRVDCYPSDAEERYGTKDIITFTEPLQTLQTLDLLHQLAHVLKALSENPGTIAITLRREDPNEDSLPPWLVEVADVATVHDKNEKLIVVKSYRTHRENGSNVVG